MKAVEAHVSEEDYVESEEKSGKDNDHAGEDEGLLCQELV
jgi:hypothetical protein